MVKPLIVALALLPCAAVAGEFEADYGLCKYTRPPAGIWWHPAYRTQMDLRTGCSLVSYLSTREGFGWRASYVNLGATQWDNVAAKRDDEQGIATGAGCQRVSGKGCTALYAGSQRVEGLSMGLTWGNGWLIGEAGMLAYRSVVHVWHLQQETTGLNWMKWHAWNATPYAGIQLRGDLFHVGVRVYNDLQAVGKCGDCLGGTNGPLYQITAGIHKEF